LIQMAFFQAMLFVMLQIDGAKVISERPGAGAKQGSKIKAGSRSRYVSGVA
jgi:hypothetical protein